eukprot:COSAG06_NODE_2456_length_6848_cov_66.970959_9_plen_118_part_00
MSLSFVVHVRQDAAKGVFSFGDILEVRPSSSSSGAGDGSDGGRSPGGGAAADNLVSTHSQHSRRLFAFSEITLYIYILDSILFYTLMYYVTYIYCVIILYLLCNALPFQTQSVRFVD